MQVRMISSSAPSLSDYHLEISRFSLCPPSLVFSGALNVKLLDNNGFETVLWTRSGAHGNVWHEAQCPVPHQLTDFRVWNKFSQTEIIKCLNSRIHNHHRNSKVNVIKKSDEHVEQGDQMA